MDVNNNGLLDGGDNLLTTGVYGADNGSVTLSFTDNLAAFGAQNLLVVYNFTGAATAGSYQAGVAGNGDLAGTNGSTGQPVAVTGAPLSGAVLSVITVTATPSFTPTFTSTSSPVPTATATRGVVSNPYPNPSQGGPVHVDIQLNGPSKVKFGVFTAAFRKIYENSFYAATNQTLVWDLKDKTGALAASGLYYLRIQVDEASGITVKIKKVLVVR